MLVPEANSDTKQYLGGLEMYAFEKKKATAAMHRDAIIQYMMSVRRCYWERRAKSVAEVPYSD